MNTYYLAAAAISVLLGLAHSILGERLIFRRLRADELHADRLLPRLYLEAIRSTWHLVTVFGWGLAAILVWMAYPGADITTLGVTLSAFLLVCSVFWLFGTRGKHPAWIVFLLIAGLCYFGSTWA